VACEAEAVLRHTLGAEAITALLLGDFDPVPGRADPDPSLP
jgi:hypothetical protein